VVICTLPLFHSLLSIMENFESALKNLLITWLKKGYTPEALAGGLQDKAALLYSLPEMKEYSDAVTEAFVANRRSADIVK